MLKHNLCARTTANLIWFFEKRISRFTRMLLITIPIAFICMSMFTAIGIMCCSHFESISFVTFLIENHFVLTHSLFLNFLYINGFIFCWLLLLSASLLCILAIIFVVLGISYFIKHLFRIYSVNVKDALEQKRLNSGK